MKTQTSPHLVTFGMLSLQYLQKTECPVSQLDEILEILRHEHVFLTGGAGTGKSYLTNEIIAHYRATDKQVISLGSTG